MWIRVSCTTTNLCLCTATSSTTLLWSTQHLRVICGETHLCVLCIYEVYGGAPHHGHPCVLSMGPAPLPITITFHFFPVPIHHHCRVF